MTSTYLLTAAFVICSVSALAQQSIRSNPNETRDQEKPAWKLSFDPSVNLLGNNGGLRLSSNDFLGIESGNRLTYDSLCFKMRSYVVKRDSKDSDSVHPVGYTTCQPASRYRLRTTEISTPSLKR